MSHNNNQSSKSTVGKFKLSSNFNQLYSQKRQQAQEFIKDITQGKEGEKSLEKNHKKPAPAKSVSLFKFNTQSQSLVDEVPVEILKKKSLSRLESIQDSLLDEKAKFNLLENQFERRQNIMRDRKELLKKYNIDLNAVMSQQVQSSDAMNKARNDENMIQEQDPEGTVKPSQLYMVKDKIVNPFTTPTIFQTPLLPCFASQFTQNPQTNASKTIREGQGVWRIGKIKIKKNKAAIKIGQIQFESQLINAQGKSVAIKDDFMYKLKNWSGIWVSQPKQQNQ